MVLGGVLRVLVAVARVDEGRRHIVVALLRRASDAACWKELSRGRRLGGVLVGGPGRAGACGVNMGDGIVCLRQVELEDFRDQAARIFLSPSHWHSYGVIGGPR